MDYETIAIGLVVALLYSIVGWIASKEEFNATKFFSTMGIQIATILGIQFVGFGDAYVEVIAPSTITYFVTKIYNIFKKKQ